MVWWMLGALGSGLGGTLAKGALGSALGGGGKKGSSAPTDGGGMINPMQQAGNAIGEFAGGAGGAISDRAGGMMASYGLDPITKEDPRGRARRIVEGQMDRSLQQPYEAPVQSARPLPISPGPAQMPRDRPLGRERFQRRPGSRSLMGQIGRPRGFDAGYFPHGGEWHAPMLPREELDETGHMPVTLNVTPGETVRVEPPPGSDAQREAITGFGTELRGADFHRDYGSLFMEPREISRARALGAAAFSDNPFLGYERSVASQESNLLAGQQRAVAREIAQRFSESGPDGPSNRDLQIFNSARRAVGLTAARIPSLDAYTAFGENEPLGTYDQKFRENFGGGYTAGEKRPVKDPRNPWTSTSATEQRRQLQAPGYRLIARNLTPLRLSQLYDDREAGVREAISEINDFMSYFDNPAEFENILRGGYNDVNPDDPVPLIPMEGGEGTGVGGPQRGADTPASSEAELAAAVGGLTTATEVPRSAAWEALRVPHADPPLAESFTDIAETDAPSRAADLPMPRGRSAMPWQAAGMGEWWNRWSEQEAERVRSAWRPGGLDHLGIGGPSEEDRQARMDRNRAFLSRIGQPFEDSRGSLSDIGGYDAEGDRRRLEDWKRIPGNIRGFLESEAEKVRSAWGPGGLDHLGIGGPDRPISGGRHF